MNEVFPFGFPFHTALYLVLYVGTLVVHFVFMNYVLAGSIVVAGGALFSGRHGASSDGPTMVGVLREWLPFALGAAITAGVAPLLFVQLLYKTEFYTANLLLEHRWMAIVPVLIVAFYLLYLLKSDVVSRGRGWVRCLVACGAALCFVFTAYSWVENHLLSLAKDEWPGFYAAERWNYSTDVLLPRLSVWFCGAFPTMSLLVAWQLVAVPRSDRSSALAFEAFRRPAVTALAGLLLMMLSVAWFWWKLGEQARATFALPVARPYVWLALTGFVVQFLAWAALLRSIRGSAVAEDQVRARSIRRCLAIASAGCLGTLVGVLVLRECVRAASIDFESLFPVHEGVGAAGGMFVFLGFLLLNGLIIAGVVVLVGRGLGGSTARGPERA